MAKISIPAEGEQFHGWNPGTLKIRKVTFGFTGSGADVIVTAQATYQLADIPAGSFVLELLANIDTAFTAALTATIGDGTSAAGFFASADLAPQTAVSTGLYKNSRGAGEALAGGKFYATADTIDVVIAGATPDAGLASVWIIYADGFNDIT
jgi:hypothetical protein